MKREILFRGKTAKGEWVYGYYLNRTNDKEDIHCIMEKFPATAAKRVIPETVGQYTGITDKNGKKIFEGDIVKILSEPTNCNFVKIEDFGVVQYDEDFAEYIIGFENVRFGEEESLGNFRYGFCEVIGTVFDKESDNGD